MRNFLMLTALLNLLFGCQSTQKAPTKNRRGEATYQVKLNDYGPDIARSLKKSFDGNNTSHINILDLRDTGLKLGEKKKDNTEEEKKEEKAGISKTNATILGIALLAVSGASIVYGIKREKRKINAENEKKINAENEKKINAENEKKINAENEKTINAESHNAFVAEKDKLLRDEFDTMTFNFERMKGEASSRNGTVTSSSPDVETSTYLFSRTGYNDQNYKITTAKYTATAKKFAEFIKSNVTEEIQTKKSPKKDIILNFDRLSGDDDRKNIFVRSPKSSPEDISRRLMNAFDSTDFTVEWKGSGRKNHEDSDLHLFELTRKALPQ